MRWFAVITLFLMVAGSIGAQPVLPKTQKAQEAAEKGQLLEAKSLVLDALKDKTEGNHPYTWYLKGYIHKRIYQELENESRSSEERELAIDAVRKSMNLDATGEYVRANTKAMTYLALSFYNDAAELSAASGCESQEPALRAYQRYMTLWRLIDPAADFTEKDIEIYKVLGSRASAIYNTDREANRTCYSKANDAYRVVLELDPNDYEANYNLAINHYNTGAGRISKINYQTDIFELILIQDECIQLFKQALPFMKMAHTQRPERYETLKGLMAIYLALGEDEKAEFFKQEIDRLIREGKIKR
jgi:hypothetical protein